MGLVSWLGGKLASGAAVPLIDKVAEVVDRFVETPDEKRIATQLFAKAQHEVNALEAVHRSVFVAGWRPFIGWVLGMSLAFYYLPQFALASIIWIRISWHAQELVPYPIQDISGLTQLIIGMLGLGGMRLLEKFGGVSK